MNKYPDYVNKYRPKGTIVKKSNETYYVYKATSKRVPGKSYPVQVIEGVIGKIDEYGFHNTEKVMIDSDVIIKECGFTNYMLMFKDYFILDANSKTKKKDRIIIFNSLICYFSPNSYLQYDKKNKILSLKELIETYKISLGRQINSIEKMIENKLSEIEELKYICRVHIGNKELKCTLNERQKILLKKLGVTEDEVR